MKACRLLAAAALAVVLGACASTPQGPGEETLAVRAWAEPEFPGARGGAEVAGVRCTLSNDRGAWTAVTPAEVTVLASTAPLEVECAADGYKTMRASFRCRSLREVQARRAASVLLLPFLLLVPQNVGYVMVELSGQATPADLQATKRSESDYPCTYGNIAPAMSRQ